MARDGAAAPRMSAVLARFHRSRGGTISAVDSGARCERCGQVKELAGSFRARGGTYRSCAACESLSHERAGLGWTCWTIEEQPSPIGSSVWVSFDGTRLPGEIVRWGRLGGSRDWQGYVRAPGAGGWDRYERWESGSALRPRAADGVPRRAGTDVPEN